MKPEWKERTAEQWELRIKQLDTKFEMAGITAPPFSDQEVKDIIDELDAFYGVLASQHPNASTWMLANRMLADAVMEKCQSISAEAEEEATFVEQSENEDFAGDEIIVDDDE
jgi:hypothetical protein